MGSRLLQITTLAIAMTSTAAIAEPMKLDLIEHAGDVQSIDAAPAGDSVGDYLSFSGEVFSSDNKTKLGTDSGMCVRVVKGARYECTWTISLADGQLMIAGPFLDAGDSTLAVTGGTGKYSTNRGQMILHARDDKGAEYDFRLALE